MDVYMRLCVRKRERDREREYVCVLYSLISCKTKAQNLTANESKCKQQKIHKLTSQKLFQMKIVVPSWKNSKRWTKIISHFYRAAKTTDVECEQKWRDVIVNGKRQNQIQSAVIDQSIDRTQLFTETNTLYWVCLYRIVRIARRGGKEMPNKDQQRTHAHAHARYNKLLMEEQKGIVENLRIALWMDIMAKQSHQWLRNENNKHNNNEQQQQQLPAFFIEQIRSFGRYTICTTQQRTALKRTNKKWSAKLRKKNSTLK